MVVKASLPNGAMIHFPAAFSLLSEAIELTVGAIDLDLESLGASAALKGHYENPLNCARFNLPVGFALGTRLNLVDVYRRGSERL